MNKLKNTLLIIGFILSFNTIGCMGTESYYNAQTAFYNAQAEASKAYVIAVSKPIAEMTAPDGTKFVVNNTNISNPKIEQANNPIVDVVKSVVNSTPLTILSSGFAVKEIVKNSSNITNNGGSVTTNSNNSTKLSNGNIEEIDNTATPTVVTTDKAVIVESEPVIVRPEIVSPEIVQPNIVNDPYLKR